MKEIAAKFLSGYATTSGAVLTVLCLGYLTCFVGIRAGSVLRALVGALLIGFLTFVIGVVSIVLLYSGLRLTSYRIEEPGLAVECLVVVVAAATAITIIRRAWEGMVEVTKHPLRSALFVLLAFLALTYLTGRFPTLHPDTIAPRFKSQN